MPNYHFGEMDASIVCTHMMLQAWELGIGSCWVGLFNADEVAEVLGIPSHIRVAALLPMGYPADDAKPIDMHFQYREMSDMVEEI
jgi:nitroreductase